MPRSPSRNPGDPFDGLLLPTSVWKILEDVKITSLEQLKTIAPRLEQIRGMDPETAQIIKDRLDRLAARRTVRVRLIFPKRPHRKTRRPPEAGGPSPAVRPRTLSGGYARRSSSPSLHAEGL
jgi:hypothetical protein